MLVIALSLLLLLPLPTLSSPLPRITTGFPDPSLDLSPSLSPSVPSPFSSLSSSRSFLPSLNISRFVLAAPSPPQLFIPRGSNYIRLNGSQGPSGPTLPVYHATFSPLFYNRTRVNASLHEMSSVYGYNYVRVFIDGGSPQRRDGINGEESQPPQPLSPGYLDNVADFLTLASAAHIYTMITLENLPANSFFANLSGPAPTWAGYPNVNVMAEGYVEAWRVFVRLLARELKQRLDMNSGSGDAPPTTSAIFAYSLANELCVDASQPPFSTPSLAPTTADGQTYDMSSSDSRQACADNNIQHWADRVAAALREEDPDVMVTLGMFTFHAVGKRGPDGIQPAADPRHPARPALLSRFSSLSFIDVHVYPLGAGWGLDVDLASEAWESVAFARMPVLMAETGAFKMFYTLEQGATELVALQGLSCARNFSGWAVWTWDTWEQGGFLWSMVDGAGAIAAALAPRTRPDPCV